MEPSSANRGFFQQPPVLQNQFYDDPSLRRVVQLFLPRSVAEAAEPDAAQLGDEVLSDAIFDYVSDAERNLPYLRGSGRDAFGRPQSELVLSEGWRKLQEFGIQKGFVAFNYDRDLGPYTRLVQFLRLHLWQGSCANTLCPAAMHDGAARLLETHLARNGLDPAQRRVLQRAFERLTSRDPARAWTSGQWMTERSGGSDVSQTETVATYAPFPAGRPAPLADAADGTPLGPWRLDGFKWFSSATDASMTILLARTRPDRGLSAFFAPVRRHDPARPACAATGVGRGRGRSALNGVTIQRLKSKLGTQSLPTAELELRGMRGWLLGAEGQGIREIATVLTITRVHSAAAALGYLGRALAVARGYARVRDVGAGRGRRVPLWRNALHVRTLAGLAGEYHARMLLLFYTVQVLGRDEHASRVRSGRRPRQQQPQQPQQQPDGGAGSLLDAAAPLRAEHVAPLLRVLSSLHKAYLCETSIPLLYGCMAALGGVGYLLNAETEHVNVARLFRDACVLPIWEGTTDVLAADTLRALQPSAPREPSSSSSSSSSSPSPSGLAALDAAVSGLLAAAARRFPRGVEPVRGEWARLRARVEQADPRALLPEARDVVFRIAEVLIAALLLVDRALGGGGGGGHNEKEDEEAGPRAVVARRFLRKRGLLAEEEEEEEGGGAGAWAGEGTLEMDQAIVYGRGGLRELQREAPKL